MMYSMNGLRTDIKPCNLRKKVKMEYDIVIKYKHGLYFGYTQNGYVESSCAYTKWGCKRNIKKKLLKDKADALHTSEVVEIYKLVV